MKDYVESIGDERPPLQTLKYRAIGRQSVDNQRDIGQIPEDEQMQSM